jgi:hypothetical protein
LRGDLALLVGLDGLLRAGVVVVVLAEASYDTSASAEVRDADCSAAVSRAKPALSSLLLVRYATSFMAAVSGDRSVPPTSLLSYAPPGSGRELAAAAAAAAAALAS